MSDKNKKFVNFAKPFVDAAKKVFETMVFTEITAQSPVIKDSNVSCGDVSASLGLSGTVSHNGDELAYKAMLVLSWPMDTYLKVASSMLMEEYTEITDEIVDVGGEISNMIMGNAKRVLAEQGYTTNMAIPTIVQGKGHQLKYPTGTTIILIPISSKHGDFYIELAYIESSD